MNSVILSFPSTTKADVSCGKGHFYLYLYLCVNTVYMHIPSQVTPVNTNISKNLTKNELCGYWPCSTSLHCAVCVRASVCACQAQARRLAEGSTTALSGYGNRPRFWHAMWVDRWLASADRQVAAVCGLLWHWLNGWLTDWLTDWLTADGPTPRSAVLLEKLTVAQLLNFLSLY